MIAFRAVSHFCALPTGALVTRYSPISAGSVETSTATVGFSAVNLASRASRSFLRSVRSDMPDHPLHQAGKISGTGISAELAIWTGEINPGLLEKLSILLGQSSHTPCISTSGAAGGGALFTHYSREGQTPAPARGPSGMASSTVRGPRSKSVTAWPRRAAMHRLAQPHVRTISPPRHRLAARHRPCRT